MQLLGRPLSVFPKHFASLHKYIGYCVKGCVLFKQPYILLYHYFTKTAPKSNALELRNGLKISLSGVPDDIITVFLIFVRNDYGKIQPQSVVVDIGANIGVFSLYAASQKARKVYAYEPNLKTYELLTHNIAQNNLEAVIIPTRLAVTDTDGGTVKFPIQSSVGNKILAEGAVEDFETVSTTTLEHILHTHDIDTLDLLKVDCEGSEYQIVESAQTPVLKKLNKIVMEYHEGPVQEMITLLLKQGFKLTREEHDLDPSGTLWFEAVQTKTAQ